MKLTTNDEIQLNSLVGTGTRTLQVSADGTIGVGAGSTTIASVIAAAAPPTTSWLMTNASVVSEFSNNNFVANVIYLTPYVTPRTFTYTGLSVNVAGAAASTNCKILIYDDLNGVPKNRIFLSTALSKATTGIKTYYENGTMSAGTLYWMGVINDTNTGSLTTITNNNSLAVSLPVLSSSPAQVVYGYLYTSTYASPISSLTASSITGSTNNNINPVIYFQTIPFAP
jgi:hypothetical protein